MKTVRRVVVVSLFAALSGCATLTSLFSGPTSSTTEVTKPPKQTLEERVESWEADEQQDDRKEDALLGCLHHLTRGVLACVPQAPVSVDPTKTSGGAPKLDCARRFHMALTLARAGMTQYPLVEQAIVQGSSPPSLDFSGGLPVDEARVLSCASSAALWRSMVQPKDSQLARSIPSALETLKALRSVENADPLGLGALSEAVLFSQVPDEYGGNNSRAAALFSRALSHGGGLKPLVHALKARYLCTSRRDLTCLRSEMSQAEANEHSPTEIRSTVSRVLQWLRDRETYLYDEAPLASNPEL